MRGMQLTVRRSGQDHEHHDEIPDSETRDPTAKDLLPGEGRKTAQNMRCRHRNLELPPCGAPKK